MPNLYGDIMSDVAAQLTGSVGLGSSVNIGDGGAMFEAIHGSAPPIAGKNIANPSGLLLSSVMMLSHIGQPEVAENIHNAWLKTIEDGVHTPDIYREGTSKQKVTTTEFTKALIERLGKKPVQLKPVHYSKGDNSSMRDWKPTVTDLPPAKKETIGCDIFLHWSPKNGTPEDLGNAISKLNGDGMKLTLITNRGVKVWPNGFPETFCTDHWRLRFKSQNNAHIKHSQIISLLMRIRNAGFDFIKMENLYLLDGKPGFSQAQGE